MTPSAEIPFWIHDRPKWISGITRQTTCQDVLHALVKAERKANGNSLGVNDLDSRNKHGSRERNSASTSKASNTNSLPRSSSKSHNGERDKASLNDERREDITCRKISRQLALVEQWRGVERPLSGTSRILKLWNAWGEEKSQVRFTIKRISSSKSATTTTNGASVVKPIQSTKDGRSVPQTNGFSKRPAPPPPQTDFANLVTNLHTLGPTFFRVLNNVMM